MDDIWTWWEENPTPGVSDEVAEEAVMMFLYELGPGHQLAS